MPLLALDQIRLVLQIAAAHGLETDRSRLPEVLGVVAGAYGFRASARAATGLVPFAALPVRGAVAHVGTRAVGEAARRYYAAR